MPLTTLLADLRAVARSLSSFLATVFAADATPPLAPVVTAVIVFVEDLTLSVIFLSAAWQLFLASAIALGSVLPLTAEAAFSTTTFSHMPDIRGSGDWTYG